jgi:hypothetical protein
MRKLRVSESQSNGTQLANRDVLFSPLLFVLKAALTSLGLVSSSGRLQSEVPVPGNLFSLHKDKVTFLSALRKGLLCSETQAEVVGPQIWVKKPF